MEIKLAKIKNIQWTNQFYIWCNCSLLVMFTPTYYTWITLIGELHSRAAPSVGGNITAQSVQPQGEIPEEGRKKL